MKPKHFKEVEKTCVTCTHINYPYTDHVWCKLYEFYLTEEGGNPEDYCVCKDYEYWEDAE